MYYIGIDVGGTNIAAGVVDKKGNIIAKDSLPTLKYRPYMEIVDDMANLSLKVVKDAGLSMDDILGIGIGFPGIVDNNDGVIKHLSNVGMTGVPIRKLLYKKLNKKISILNDATAAALGEYKLYGDNVDSFIFVTLGTGIGGGIIINGKAYSGFNGAGSELGHFIIEKDGEDCSCGCKGCWEQYGSVTALVKLTKRVMEKNPSSMMHKWKNENGKVTGRTAFDCAKKGDKAAKKVVDLYIDYLTTGIITIINVMQPEKLVIGGGISKEGDYLLNPIKEKAYSCQYNNYVKRTEISIAKLYNDAGIIGAAFFAMD